MTGLFEEVKAHMEAIEAAKDTVREKLRVLVAGCYNDLECFQYDAGELYFQVRVEYRGSAIAVADPITGKWVYATRCWPFIARLERWLSKNVQTRGEKLRVTVLQMKGHDAAALMPEFRKFYKNQIYEVKKRKG